MDHAENIFRKWAKQEYLSLLYTVADEMGEPVRLWWFFSDIDLISPRDGLCDDEVVMFFSAYHKLTFTDRLLIDQQQTQ